MAPPIRYVRNADGLNIAYYTMGSGRPFITMSPTLGHSIELEWDIPIYQRIWSITAQSFALTRFDPHGCGLSDRNDADLSLESYLHDLEAVADAVAPDTFALWGSGATSTVGIAYAARHPERVSHLMLSTALTERLGDAAFRERSRAIDAAIREAVRAAGGAPVEGKVMGDGVMSTFASARQAIDAALRCREASAAHELPLHLGIHAGDVIRERDNVYGGAVNIAARICDASEPGEILVSDIVRGLARTSAGVAFDDRGEHALKGIDEPQRLWAVVAQSQ